MDNENNTHINMQPHMVQRAPVTRVVALYWQSQRQEELDTAIMMNVKSPDVDEVLLIADAGCRPTRWQGVAKVKIVTATTQRPTYREIFQIANAAMTSPHDRTVLLNTDCWFEPGDLAKLKGLDTRQFVFCVTRHDVGHDLTPVANFKPWWNGRDAWVFTGRIRPMKWLDFRPGCPNCDWYLDWQIQHAGYVVVNPYYDLRLWHFHVSEIRTHGTYVHPAPELLVGFIRDLYPTRLVDLRIPTGTVTGILSYSLYGQEPMYTHGALINAEMARFIYPGFIPRFYVDDTVTSDVIARLRELLVEIVVMPRGVGSSGSLWRLKALEDVSVDYVCIRDVDSRLSTRDRLMFDAWVADGTTDYHLVRDHPYHRNSVILAYFDSRRPLKIPPFDFAGCDYGCDERFMEAHVIPLLRGSIATHDIDGSGPRLPGITLPSPPRSDHWNLYVGAKVWPDSGIENATVECFTKCAKI